MTNHAGIVQPVRLIRSPLSISGMVLTTISAIVFLVVFFADLFGMHTNPYIGILFFLILPGIFLVGLILIPLGALIERRRRAAGKKPSELLWPRVDLNNPHHRRVAVAIFALTIVNIVIVSLAAYRGVEYMDSVQFCGQACHRVMKPEATAHQDGPHARVTCVECHIGSGASWFARSKVSGMRQVVAVTFHTYSRPIPSPVQSLRPARDTCEQCHWPAKFEGDKVRRIVEYGDDEKNTQSVTTLQMHVGGASERVRSAVGIHWHADVANQIDYITTDVKRQVIPYVQVRDRTGAVREVRGRRRDSRSAVERGAPAHGLHGLPQPPEPSDGGDGRARSRRSDGEHRHSEPAVRPARGGESPEGDLSHRRRGDGRHREGIARFLSRHVRGDLHLAPAGRREGGDGRPAGLPSQCVPRNERPVRHVS